MSRLLKVNMLNLGLLAVVGGICWLFPLPVGILSGVLWAGYATFSNYVAIKQNQDEVDDFIYDDIDYDKELKLADRKGLFVREIDITLDLIKSVEEKKKFFDELEPDSNIRDTYEISRRQFYINTGYILRYIQNYDYIMKPEAQKQNIKKQVDQNMKLVTSLNNLVSEMIAIDKSVENNVDTRVVDDIVSSLRSMTNEQ